MSDEFYDGRRIRVLALVDNHTRESLAIHVGQRIRGIDVVQVLEGVVKQHGQPQTIQVDNGPEFISKDLDLWAYMNRSVKNLHKNWIKEGGKVKNVP